MTYFEPGDIVTIKSGSPNMVVTNLEDAGTTIVVTWYEPHDGVTKMARVPAVAFKLESKGETK